MIYAAEWCEILIIFGKNIKIRLRPNEWKVCRGLFAYKRGSSNIIDQIAV